MNDANEQGEGAKPMARFALFAGERAIDPPPVRSPSTIPARTSINPPVRPPSTILVHEKPRSLAGFDGLRLLQSPLLATATRWPSIAPGQKTIENYWKIECGLRHVHDDRKPSKPTTERLCACAGRRKTHDPSRPLRNAREPYGEMRVRRPRRKPRSQARATGNGSQLKALPLFAREECLHRLVVFLASHRTRRVRQRSARRHMPGGSTQHAKLRLRERGHVLGLQAPANLGMASQRSQPRARRVDEHLMKSNRRSRTTLPNARASPVSASDTHEPYRSARAAASS